jgi:hypothetical protein
MEQTMNELETYHYDDLFADLSSAIEQRGARAVMLDFWERYPSHYREVEIVVLKKSQKQVPALFQRHADPV